MKRLDPRSLLVFDTRALGPGSARSETRTAPAPAELGVELVSVPEGGDLDLDVRLEGVAEGVLVTATVTAPLAGECARCLEEFSSAMRVRFQELFAYDATGEAEDDGYLLDGDLLDLEPAVRDALVLELPLSPLCDIGCPGLCSQCGVRLAEAGPDHGHADEGGVWAVLKDFRAEAAGSGEQDLGEQDPGEHDTGVHDTGEHDTGEHDPGEHDTGEQEWSVPDGTPVPEGTPDGMPVPGRAKES